MKSIFCICCVLIDWTLAFQTVLELTDGWYKIKGMIDRPLSGLVDKKKICVGTKLCMFGAELVGSQNPSPPLQVSNYLFFSLKPEKIDIHLPHPCISESSRHELFPRIRGSSALFKIFIGSQICKNNFERWLRGSK